MKRFKPFLAFACLSSLAVAADPVAEFFGPFPSWADVKTEFGAVGDGKADDTAAIQRALESVRSKESPKKVLYFPAGTYRLTTTLRLDRISHHEPLGMSIVGEHPETTILAWDGAAEQSMLLYDAWYASLSRFTFDGRGKAKTAIEHGPNFATANECTDVIIKDVDFGIEAGQKDGIAETAVLRCRFHRCAKAAISIQGFNSLDWYIWDSWFEDCGVGVTNEFGAGNFHVYHSNFLRSKDADLTIRHTGYFSFLGNTSIGSRRFFHAKRAENWKATETWGSQATLQDNLILDPLIRVQGPSQATFRNLVVNAGNGAVGILVENCDQPGGRVYGEQLNATGFEYGLVSDGLRQTTVEFRDAGHNGMQVVGGGPETKSWVALFSGASSRHRHHAPGIHLYDVQNDGRLFVRDIWYEGDSWSLLNLDGSGAFAYHCGFVAPADPNHLDKTLEWEKNVRGSVAALQFSGFKGRLAFTLVSSNGGNVRIVPPSAGTKLYVNGFITYDGKVDFGGAAMQGEAVVDHLKAFRKDGSGLDSTEGVGKASPEFIREMLAPLRTVKPQPLTDKGRDSSDVRFHRVWANGKNGVRLEAKR